MPTGSPNLDDVSEDCKPLLTHHDWLGNRPNLRCGSCEKLTERLKLRARGQPSPLRRGTPMSITQVFEELKKLATVDLFAAAKGPACFVGRPFYFDYAKLKLLVNDAGKAKVGGSLP